MSFAKECAVCGKPLPAGGVFGGWDDTAVGLCWTCVFEREDDARIAWEAKGLRWD